jgi:Xaa-Pro aminopeptidase
MPGTDTGYVHSLGHGIGLNVHESPGISHQSPEKTVFKAGNVVTIEPGLYYPDRGYGIRVEDSVYIDENGHLHNLTNFPYDLVIPLDG